MQLGYWTASWYYIIPLEVRGDLQIVPQVKRSVLHIIMLKQSRLGAVVLRNPRNAEIHPVILNSFAPTESIPGVELSSVDAEIS
jgi:hypothetical protein